MDMRVTAWVLAGVVTAGVIAFGLYLTHKLKKELQEKQAAQAAQAARQAAQVDEAVIEKTSASAGVAETAPPPAAEGSAQEKEVAAEPVSEEKIRRLMENLFTVSTEQRFQFSMRGASDADMEELKKLLEKEQISADALQFGPLVKSLLESKMTTPAAVPLDLKPKPRMREAAQRA